MNSNIRRVAEQIAHCRHKEEVKNALSLILKPCIQYSHPMDKEVSVTVADILASADIPPIN